MEVIVPLINQIDNNSVTKLPFQSSRGAVLKNACLRPGLWGVCENVPHRLQFGGFLT
jgi:hypothetical protein